MYIYADHNFLIYCVKNPKWREAVVNAHQSGTITVVLSHWHFYEYGNARTHADTEQLIQFAEELQPKWILERAVLQHQEFIAHWNAFWAGSAFKFEPICTLPEAAAALNRVPPERMAQYTIRDYVAAFSAQGALDEIRAGLKVQTEFAKFNLERYVRDKMFSAIFRNTEVMHVAMQLARLTEPDAPKAKLLAEFLLTQEPVSTQIHCFVFWRGTDLLKSYVTEVAFTLDLYPSRAILNANRQIDRFHAIPALPYCDVLVTNDADLIRRCERVKGSLQFETAYVVNATEFIAML